MHRNANSSAALVLSIASLGAVAAGGCTSILGINKDYRELDGGTGGGSSSGGPMSSSGSTGGGAASTSSGAGGGGNGPVAVWQQRLGGPGTELAGHPGVDLSVSGDVFITGAFQNPTDLGNGPLPCATPQCLFLAKLDKATGKPVWSRSLADSSGPFSSLAATPDGGVVVAGSFSATFTPSGMSTVPTVGGNDMFLAKFDAMGACQWHREFGDMKDQRANVVAVDDNGMIYLAGNFSGSFSLNGFSVTEASGPNAFIAQFDSGGICKWVRQFNTPSEGLSLAPIAGGKGTAFGGLFSGTISLGGGISITSITSASPFLTAFDAAGTPLSAKAFSGTDINLATNGLTGGAVFALTSFNGPGSPIGMGDLSMDGTALSSPVPIPGTEQGHLESITCTPTGRRVLTGYSAGDLTLGKPIKNNGAKDIFLAHLDTSASVLSGAGYGDAMIQSGRNVRADQGGNIYLFGDFQGAVDFGIGPLASAGSSDMFIVKFSYLSFP